MSWGSVVLKNDACACRLVDGRQQRSQPRGHHVSTARQKTWVVMVAKAQTSRESQGAGVLAVPYRGTWESEAASAALSKPGDYAGMLDLDEEMSAEYWTLCADVICGVTVLSETRDGCEGHGQGLSCASDAIHVCVHWKWNQARRGGRR